MFRWRAWLTGKEVDSQEESPVSLHPETVPFLYESFETALVDSFPQLGQELLTGLTGLGWLVCVEFQPVQCSGR